MSQEWKVTIERLAKWATILAGAVAWIVSLNYTLEAFVTKVHAEHQSIIEQHAAILPMLRQICRNTAQTELQRERCDTL